MELLVQIFQYSTNLIVWEESPTVAQASTQRDSAWNSGAHLIATVFPAPPYQGFTDRISLFKK